MPRKRNRLPLASPGGIFGIHAWREPPNQCEDPNFCGGGNWEGGPEGASCGPPYPQKTSGHALAGPVVCVLPKFGIRPLTSCVCKQRERKGAPGKKTSIPCKK